MIACRTLVLAAALLGAAGSAWAQFPAAPGEAPASPFPSAPGEQQRSPFPAPGQAAPPPASGGFPSMGGSMGGMGGGMGGGLGAPQRQAGPQQVPPACKLIMDLGEERKKRMDALNAAGKRKATPKETCPMFTSFTNTDAKFLKALQDGASTCSIEAKIIAQVKDGAAKSSEIRARVCQAAAAGPARPSSPSLSDALGTSRVPSSETVKPGRGTFDTLTGTPLGGGSTTR